MLLYLYKCTGTLKQIYLAHKIKHKIHMKKSYLFFVDSHPFEDVFAGLVCVTPRNSISFSGEESINMLSSIFVGICCSSRVVGPLFNLKNSIFSLFFLNSGSELQDESLSSPLKFLFSTTAALSLIFVSWVSWESKTISLSELLSLQDMLWMAQDWWQNSFLLWVFSLSETLSHSDSDSPLIYKRYDSSLSSSQSCEGELLASKLLEDISLPSIDPLYEECCVKDSSLSVLLLLLSSSGYCLDVPSKDECWEGPPDFLFALDGLLLTKCLVLKRSSSSLSEFPVKSK